MKQFTVPMALVDLVPVLLFFLAVRMIITDFRESTDRDTALRFFEAGSLLIVYAGLVKACYKLLYALNVGDFVWMSKQFFGNQAVGFLIAGAALMALISGQNDFRASAVVPVMTLVGIMIVGSGAMTAALCSLANRCGKRNALILFVISFFLMMCMGYLSSKNFDRAAMNWVAQGVNCVGRLCLYTGVKILHDAGWGSIL